MALSLTIDLSDSEEQLLKDIARQANPDATNAFLKEWAQAVAKKGLRDELGTIQLDQIRQQENESRATAKDQFAAWFPEVPQPPPVEG
jgi:hypothetical protein